jgi:Tubulin like
MANLEEKSMVPTLLVGIGGTGHESLARVRRLAEEAYGKLDNFPLLGFLLIDTDKEHKLANPETAGTPFLPYEKFHASVSSGEFKSITSDLRNFPWIDDWFPSELKNDTDSVAIEAGAGQIRAYGRLALFLNYRKIRENFIRAIARIKGHEDEMLRDHQVKVLPGINVFVVGSLSGGTGSGMIIDMGYCIQRWLADERSSKVTAIVPMPNAFNNIGVGARVLANGYAALMELNYFSDGRNEYSARFSNNEPDKIKSKSKPFDFTYLIGTKNGEREFELEDIRGIIAQNIFLDLTSDFAPYKRSIRDNIESNTIGEDSLGIGYPRNFMSVGLSAIEIPVLHIHTSLAYRLATDFIEWWKNASVPLPPDIIKLVQGESFLKGMKLTEQELLSSLYYGNEKSLLAEISEFISEIRDEVIKNDRLQCTQEGINFISAERGKILQFLAYLQPKVNEFRQTRLREESPDPRIHGAYFQKMYDNRNQIVQRGRKALDVKFYEIVEDRNYGIKFAEAFIINTRQVLTTASENFRQGVEKTWQPKTDRGSRAYEDALQGISQFRDKYAGTKKTDMEKRFNEALEGLEIMASATIQRKSRALGIEVIQRLQEHLNELESRLVRLNQKLEQFRGYFKDQAELCAENADTLTINGIKLYNREELNSFYTDLLVQSAGMTEGSKKPSDQGMERICTQLSKETLAEASPLWQQDRQADEIMNLFDLPMLKDIADRDFLNIIFKHTKKLVDNPPSSSLLKNDLSAADRLWKAYNDEKKIRGQIEITHNKSKPLIVFDRSEVDNAGGSVDIDYSSAIAILGGSNTADKAAQDLIPFLLEKVGAKEINPLGESERHRIIFVQEVGGFSLRCIDGMKELQKSYRDWKGKIIEARRDQLKGGNKSLPIPVHIQKEPPFWDIFPDDPKIFDLVIIARAFGILRSDINKQTEGIVIRYQMNSAAGTGIKNIDIGSTWEEVVQVLQLPICSDDREEIQRQKKVKIGSADTSDKKQKLHQEALAYLDLRKSELGKLGGSDSREYMKEDDVITRFIMEHKLNSDLPTTISEAHTEKKSAPIRENSDLPTIVYAAPVEQPNDKVVCSCGSSNPATSKFCQECGTPMNLNLSKSV